MSMDLTGITNVNEYYTNHYFSSIFEENASETISVWRADAKDNENIRTPWAQLRDCGKAFYPIINRYRTNRNSIQTLQDIRAMADNYLKALGYPNAAEFGITVEEEEVPVYLEMKKANGAPLLWVLLAHNNEEAGDLMNSKVFSTGSIDTDSALYADVFADIQTEDLIGKLLFGLTESPRFLMIITMSQIALIDREKWNAKRYLQFELEDIFSRREETTLQAMSVLLHKESICPDDGKILLDTLSDNSQRHASGVSQDLKYALRECIEILGNEVIYYQNSQGEPVIDAGKLTLECLRYMYRMLFVLFIEARPELGFAPIKEQTYFTGYSLESLRDIADNIRDDIDEVGGGYYLHETLSKLYELIYTGYPQDTQEYMRAMKLESKHDLFVIPPLKAHIFDPEFTPTLAKAKIRNKVMLRIVDLMSLTRAGGRNTRRGRISYANLGINQMGAVYEALLSYRGFIAAEDLYEVKVAGDKVDDLDVGYFVPERELDQYTEDERVRTADGKLRIHKKGEFIYRLAGREREKSASYYTPECLTQCLVKYALKELLKDKSADEILDLTVCEPAMGSAAFLNEAIDQLAEAYLDRKQKELGTTVSSESRQTELQKIKMYIADNNVYGIDLNPVAVELAEVSLWLNTIYEGGYVPWFGAQLVNGNSLIGARRQGYAAADLTATSKNLHWYEKAPDRIPFGRSSAQQKRIYHFLLGDPGMCSYSDKVIKSLAPDNIKLMKDWNKYFTKPYTEAEINTLKELSKYIDKLWNEQIKARRELQKNTVTALDVFGHEDTRYEYSSSIRSIREKDKFLNSAYKTDKAKNAGAYARLKFAMDYWCALWFWPIDKAEELPSRAEFLQDMDFILHGVMPTEVENNGQTSLFEDDTPDEEGITLKNTEVDIPQLCELFPRLALVRKIANDNKFMHWELEFADVFADKDGFDLVIGNPPWIRLEWDEQALLSDKKPLFVIRNLTSAQTLKHRNEVLSESSAYQLYFSEYEEISGEQSFFNAVGNYYELMGMKANLYKCFLPQAWKYSNDSGVFAFVHPDGVFDDSNGGVLRKALYPRLKKHFQFENELNLFEGTNDHGRMRFSLNVYKNGSNEIRFDIICNLFASSTVDACYEKEDGVLIPGIKDENNNWNIKGHSGRVVTIEQRELQLFSKLFDDNCAWDEARLPVIHAQILLEALERIGDFDNNFGNSNLITYSTVMWDETKSQKDGINVKTCSFPDTNIDTIYSGPHIGLANPLFKGSRRICVYNSDYDIIDLTNVNADFVQRFKYSPACDKQTYISKSPNNGEYINNYRLVMREMLNLSGERTLIPTIIPPECGHILTVFGMALKGKVIHSAGVFASIITDFYIKTVGRGHIQLPILKSLPIFDGVLADEISLRSGLLNCMNSRYLNLWAAEYKDCFSDSTWSKSDPRLDNKRFSTLTSEWTWETPLRTDYERRQALVEIDVLTAMALGMTLEQLKTIYRIQFPVLQQYEADTWYDANGRIVFTTNRSLVGVGFDRPTWENGIKGAEPGKKFYRTITDDTQPGGPVERTIEYVAPFDKCDREQDYETAWKFFEGKFEEL